MSVPTKVIIIDDDKPSVTVLTNELKAYQDVNVIATAFNSHDGEQAILKHKPQLIFLDIELPGINGLEFLAALRPKIPVKTSQQRRFIVSHESLLFK